MTKKKKVRADFRKNREARTRDRDLTRKFQQEDFDEDQTRATERVRGKGNISRKRTIVTTEEETVDETTVPLAIDVTQCEQGRVLTVQGLVSTVVSEASGKVYRCATRRLLKTLSTDQRHVVATGDRVAFRTSGEDEGIIERIEPRHGLISRTSRGRQHVMVANVDRLLVVASAAMPDLKPHLIDRFLVTAASAEIEPVICINKIDLVDSAGLQPLIGVYAQMGYHVLALSAERGDGIEQLRALVRDKQSAVAGQSGVGKSSLLNAIQPGLELAVSHVSAENEKGRHTTTSSRLIPLQEGGWIVDTPGIRQFQLWDVIPEEIAGFCPDIRPYVSACRFPDCTHVHETECAVKDAVADGYINLRRYDSYCQMLEP